MSKPLDEKVLERAQTAFLNAVVDPGARYKGDVVIQHLNATYVMKKVVLAVLEAMQVGEGEAVDGMPKQIDLYKVDAPGSMYDGRILQFQPNMQMVKPTRYFRSDANAAIQAENERLREALRFYRDAWDPEIKLTVDKERGWLCWEPTEQLLNDCGNTAIRALAGQEKQEGGAS